MSIPFRKPTAQDSGSGEKSNLFLKLVNDKDSAKGVFRGVPFELYQHWVDKKAYPCTDQGCQYCAQGNKRSFRFRLNIIFKENGVWTAKIFEGPWSIYDQLRLLQEQGWNLEKNPVTITRNGTGQTTTWSVVPIPNTTLTSEQESQIAQVKLNELDPSKKVQAPQGGANASQGGWSDDIPF